MDGGGARQQDISLKSILSPYDVTRPVDWAQAFGRVAPLRLEIGSGLGEYITSQAQADPGTDFIGIELDWLRVKKTLRRLARLRDSRGEEAVRNVRILQVEATSALKRLFRPEALSQVTCLFPCPWPKKAHTKFRLFSHQFLCLLNSRLSARGQVHIVTDYAPYFSWVGAQVRETGFQVETRKVRSRFDTKFEKKWRAEGQDEFYEMLLTKARHIAIPLEEDRTLQVYFVDEFDPGRFVFPEIVGDPSIIQKGFLFDPQRRQAMVHLVVAEQDIVQHLWVMIGSGPKGWCVSRAEGHTVLPTRGVAVALKMVTDAVKDTMQKQES